MASVLKMRNRYEQANVDTIVKYEKRMGYNGR